MFSPQIIDSDAFLDMSPSAQNLYFHLGMRADDDGFVGSPKKILKIVGGNDDDLKILLAKRFVLGFESGVVVIKHWLIHNLIRSDLYKETQYKKEKSTLGLNENGAYTELRSGVSEIKAIEAPEWLKRRRKEQRTANVPLTALRIGKDRIGKDREEQEKYPPSYLKGIPKEDVSELVSIYDISESQIKLLADKILVYCESKGRTYKNYKAALRSWVMKDFKKRSDVNIKL